MLKKTRAWKSRINKYFSRKQLYQQSLQAHTIYQSQRYKDILIVCLFLDDLFFIGCNPSLFREFKGVMEKEFEMTNVELMAYYYLGISSKRMVFISQESYTKDILKKFKMNECKLISTPMECRVKLSKHKKGESVNISLLNLHKA